MKTKSYSSKGQHYGKILRDWLVRQRFVLFATTPSTSEWFQDPVFTSSVTSATPKILSLAAVAAVSTHLFRELATSNKSTHAIPIAKNHSQTNKILMNTWPATVFCCNDLSLFENSKKIYLKWWYSTKPLARTNR